jgi:nitroreductase
MRIDAFISFGLQAKMSLQRRIGPIFRGSVCDTFNVAYDKERMQAQHGRNYQFFDAPVGLFFTIDRVMQQGSLLDYGMFLQNIMIAARAHGLSTCHQAAFMKYHKVISEQLRLETTERFVVGMSLGFADASCIENTLVTERAEVGSFTTFYSD